MIFEYWLVANLASFYQMADDFEVFAVTELPGSNNSALHHQNSDHTHLLLTQLTH